jgi:hypothetical protein
MTRPSRHMLNYAVAAEIGSANSLQCAAVNWKICVSDSNLCMDALRLIGLREHGKGGLEDPRKRSEN